MPEPERNLVISEDRHLSEKETELVGWLLENGSQEAKQYLAQVESLRVVSRCGCGCASVDFSVNGVEPDRKSAIDTLSDYCWGTGGEDLRGIFVFARDRKLAGLEVWSIDGLVTPAALPDVEGLREFPGNRWIALTVIRTGENVDPSVSLAGKLLGSPFGFFVFAEQSFAYTFAHVCRMCGNTRTFRHAPCMIFPTQPLPRNTSGFG